ncbi:MAG: tyrosine--tRNA ligase [Chloroflexi bacterium]|nr:MAG: tyrosine--tRNA ligase [Chloroflexota bacterium]
MAGVWGRLRERAVEIHEEAHLQRRLEAGEKLRVKLGMDPTAPDIHAGHLVVLDVLRLFQDEGHTAVLIVGDYTARIGDPSGRSETRPVLSREQVEANAQTYLDQAYRVLDRDRTEVRRNSEWLEGMTAADILHLLGTQTLQSVLQREDFAKRLKEGHPVGAHEILYPFSQAYDSVAVDADLEIGGTDQLFNLLYGRDIMRAYGKAPQDVAVFPLLEGLDGVNKMSKSLGNYIGITEPPEEVYGKVMSIPDELTARYARLLLGRDELPDNPRDAKAEVARGLVQRLHGAEAAGVAEGAWDRLFRHRELPSELSELRPTRPNLITALLEAGFAKSASEARRLLQQGGVRVDGDKVAEDLELADGNVVSAGKRKFVRVRLR